MGKKIKTLKDLHEFTGLLSLPRKPLEIAQVVNDIADRNVRLEGEALEALGLAFRGITHGTSHAIELVNEQLESRFERVGKRHAKHLLELWTEIIAFDYSQEDKAKLSQQLLSQSHEQVMQEKKIFGDLARIAAIGIVGVAYIGATAVGYKQARPKNIWDILNKFI